MIAAGVLMAIMLVTAVAVSYQIRRTNRLAISQPKTTSNTSFKNSPVPPSTQAKAYSTPEKPIAPPTGSSGIKGQLYAGVATGCYSTDQNSSCNQPRLTTGTVIVQTINSATKEAGSVIATVVSNSNGYYLLTLDPGEYQVKLQPQGGGSGSTAVITVKSGQFATVDLMAF